METTDGGLFLLEVLIDNVSFVKSSCFSDEDFRTCVTIEATAVEPLEICDDDPGACVAKSGGPFVNTFNSGKLCLFSLPEAEITKAMSSFPIRVTVHKYLPCGCLPTKIVMGTATIDMTEKFVQSRKKYMNDPTSVNFQALKDSFQLFAGDGGERVGDILMFLRISCFGKLIITRFQGEGLPNLRTSQEASIVDGSCIPHWQFQTSQDPCVCCAAKVAGAGRGTPGTCPPCQHGGGHGGGPCPMTQDSYNSTPCQNPGDICYCSGPSPPSKHPIFCRNMDQYCLHVPEGILPSLPIYQDLTEEQILEIKSTNQELKLLHVQDHFNSSSIAGSSILCSETATIVDEYSKSLTDTGFSSESIEVKLDHSASLCTIWSKRRSVSFSDKVDYASKSYNHFPNYRKNYSNEVPKSIFGEKITTVYVTLFEDLCRRHTSGTQATASVNKCLQASQSKDGINSNINNHFVCSNSTVNTSGSAEPSVQDHLIRYSDIYFFGKSKSDKKLKKGMGSTKAVKKDTVSQASSHTSASAQPQLPNKVQSSAASVQAQPPYKSESIQYSYYATTRAKTVSIKDRPCPGVTGVTKGEVVATLSHIIIGPRGTCPVHGREPCQGPKCVIAASGLNASDQAAVKVTTVTNPRRGVFELVIRKLTGAPLARNELMLEWTPPPCRPPACGSQCPTPCVLTPSCRPSKCKMIVCRPTPCRPAKCCTKPCRSPCTRCSRTSCGKPCSSCKPCRPCVPASYLCRPCPPSPRCRPCPPRPPSSLCTPCPPSPRCRPCPPLPRCRPCPPPPRRWRCRPLRRCRPCPPTRCRPCPPTPRCRPCPPKPCEAPCAQPCGSPCCDLPCKSSPCLRPCPVGYRKPRKIRCQQKIRAHRKLISPCLNRSKACPMVRCRSVPGPCVGCCGAPPCIPRKCCSIFPWRPRKCPVYACSIRKCGLSPCPPVPCPPQKCCLASRYKIKNCCGQGC